MCGISGYIAKDKIQLQKSTIKTLGVFNDSRGGDSCGIFIDGEVEYGVNEEKLFSNFMEKSVLLSKNTKTKVVLTHCRKRSVGGISLETAQPVVIKNSDGEADFCLIHNGTIHNAEALWAKHNETPLSSTLTDSQMMAHLFYNYGYDDLAHYNGAAVFVIVDYRKDREKPEVLFFKGSSLENYISKKSSEERPLYVAFEDKMLLFSSIKLSLKCVTDKEVLVVLPNKLCKYIGNDLVVVKEYDREERHQCREYATSKNACSSTYDDQYGNDYYDDKFNYRHNQKAARKASFPPTHTGSLGWDGSKKLEYRINEGKTYFQYKPAHGKHVASCFGYTTTTYDVQEMWFYDGYMLKGGEQTFNFLVYLQKENKALCPTESDFSDLFISVIRRFSAIPIWSNTSKKYENEPEYGNIVPFSGDFAIPFNSDYKIMKIVDGIVTETTVTSYNTYKVKFNERNNIINSFYFYWNNEKENYKANFDL